jgi:Ser/Thr protein kinase RdoA (MazF antagonist)
MLQPFDPGAAVDSCSGDTSDVWRQLGHYARNVHGIAVGGFGDQLSDITPGTAKRSWSVSVRYNIEPLRAADPLRRMDVVTGAQSAMLRAKFEALASREFRRGLCHGDLALHNVLVDEIGTVHLLDWGCAEANIVPHYDLIRMTEWKGIAAPEFNVFLDGYGIDTTAFEAMRSDLAILTVLKAIDLTRWAIDRMPSAIDAHAARARRLVRAYVATAGSP